MATSKQKIENQKGDLRMKTPLVVSQQEWDAARQQLLGDDLRVQHRAEISKPPPLAGTDQLGPEQPRIF